MKLSDKILMLRKKEGMSQEQLAEKLNVSRQAISRWESGSALPDANNIRQLSRVFAVSADYLLNDDVDEYEKRQPEPEVQAADSGDIGRILIYLITLEVMVLLIQFMSVVILQNMVFAFLSFLPFVAAIGGFEYACQKNAGKQTVQTNAFRRRFYKISAWLGLYFPVRFLMSAAAAFYPRPYSSLLFEVLVLVVYMCAAVLVNLAIDKQYIMKEQ
ncbi:MAG: helix-turn-helix transcriptional regulator [Peptococcaceae bacterium]|nr:helix-turn-helix transcriptional regulator [Peptococcaceae bacterium]